MSTDPNHQQPLILPIILDYDVHQAVSDEIVVDEDVVAAATPQAASW